MTSRRFPWARVAPILLLVLIALVVAACAGAGAPGASGAPPGSPTPHPPLTPGPARRGPDQPPGLGVHPDLPGDVHHPGRDLRHPAQPGRARGDRLGDRRAHAHRAGDGHPALPPPARLAAPDAAAPARGQGDPAALQGRRGQGPDWPSRSCSRSAASTRWPAACRSCSRCPCCSSCIRSSRTG